jgi:hypothetical protein
MAGQSTQMTRSEAISVQRSIERGPAKPTGSKNPNCGVYGNGTGVAVPTK